MKGFISNELFKLAIIVLPKIYAAGKIFGIGLKAIRDLFSNMWSVISGGTRAPNFLVRVIFNRRGKFKLLVLQGDPLP